MSEEKVTVNIKYKDRLFNFIYGSPENRKWTLSLYNAVNGSDYIVMEALAERPDVTLRISFLDEKYKGNRVTVTIPAGTDTLSLVDENGFVGFLYVAVKYGYTFVN